MTDQTQAPGLDAAPAPRPWAPAVSRGAARRCPCCGEGALFNGFLKVRDVCDSCGEELRHHRADDLPAFLAILFGGKLMIALMMVSEKFAPMGDAGQYAWPIIAMALVALMISPIKGAVVGVQWSQRMHGFGEEPETYHDPSTTPEDPKPARA